MKTIKALVLEVIIAALSPLIVAYAQTSQQTPLKPITDQAGLQNFMCNIIGWFFWIVIVISVIMVLYAAFTYATARDDTERTSRARRTLTYAAIGIAVALLAGGFPRLVASVFPTTVSFNQIGSCGL